ncbi:MAG TPA: hypothetical protein PK044_04980, partial [Exilispira sp.]|nr:hypothetical protein [Exilispira sp.]
KPKIGNILDWSLTMKFFKFFKKKNNEKEDILSQMIDHFIDVATVEIAGKLQDMFNQPIIINNMVKSMIDITELPMLIGNEEDTAISVIFEIENEIQGKIAILISNAGAKNLYNLLTQKNIENIEEKKGYLLPEVSSCIESVASIFAMTFVSAISNFIQKPIFTSVPVISYSYRDSVINEIVIDQTNSDDSLEIYISKFLIENIEGYFLFVPKYVNYLNLGSE